MSNKKFTDLPVAATALLTDIIAAVQGGVTSQETLQKVADLLGLGSGRTSFNNTTGNASLVNGLILMKNPTVAGVPPIVVAADNNAGNGLMNLSDSGAGHQAYVNFADGAGNTALFGLAGLTFVLQSNTTPNLAVQQTGGADGSIKAGGATFSGVVTCNSSVTITSALTVGGNSGLITMISATAVLDFPSTNAQNSSDLTMTVNNAQVGDSVFIGVPTAAVNPNSDFTAWVSAANTVNIRFNNYSAGAINPASGTFRATVLRFP